MTSAFRCPTSTTRRLPRVTPVYQVPLQHRVILRRQWNDHHRIFGYSEPWLLWIVVAYASTSSPSSPKPYAHVAAIEVDVVFAFLLVDA
jgi:hypothetical protein